MTAAAPAWILSALVLATSEDITFGLITLYFLIATTGGALSGYLVARRSFQAPLRMAVFFGLGSYGLLAVVDWLLSIASVYDMSTVIGFPVGFAIGSRVVELRQHPSKSI
jgi:hypothetical protein